jgi:hypothetical protein
MNHRIFNSREGSLSTSLRNEGESEGDMLRKDLSIRGEKAKQLLGNSDERIESYDVHKSLHTQEFDKRDLS